MAILRGIQRDRKSRNRILKRSLPLCLSLSPSLFLSLSLSISSFLLFPIYSFSLSLANNKPEGSTLDSPKLPVPLPRAARFYCLLSSSQKWRQPPSSSSMADKRSCDTAPRRAESRRATPRRAKPRQAAPSRAALRRLLERALLLLIVRIRVCMIATSALVDHAMDKGWFTFLIVRLSVTRTPISRLPIMAKSVLDLYELYKLVVLRGGLVEVINKKLWQEIIKGLRLPASITSAAFTLRTQYMKYLYPYEREKEKLSTTEQLQTAIETNRRESRRNNYAAYTNNENLMPRTQHSTALQNSLPLSIAQMAVAANESQHHGPQSLVVNGHPHAPQHHPQHLAPNLSPSVQLSISEYMMRILRDRIPTNGIIPHQGNSPTPPPGTVEGVSFKSGLEMPRLNLWNICPSGYPGNNNMYAPGMGQPSSFSPPTSQSPLAPANSPEPQREALDLANSGHRPANTPPSSSDAKRSQESTDLASPSPKRKLVLSDEGGNNTIGTYHTVHIKQVPSLGENGKKQLEISVQIDGILYEGVLAPKHDEDSDESMSPNNNNNNNHNNNNNGKRTHNENET
ncbi:hypothetical protein P5V15_009075 [Pogonomyrmex californicus]